MTEIASVHFRMDCEHQMVPEVVEYLFGEEPWYIYYLHNGDGTGKPPRRDGKSFSNKQHFHIWLPPRDKAAKQLIRDRAKAKFGVSGSDFTCGDWKGCLLKGISYGSHEGTLPVTKGDVQQWLDDAPAWVPFSEVLKKRKRRRVGVLSDGECFEMAPKINIWNYIQYMVHHYKKFESEIDPRDKYRSTLRHMIQSRAYDWHFTQNMHETGWRIQFLAAIGDEEGARNLEEYLIGNDMYVNPNV